MSDMSHYKDCILPELECTNLADKFQRLNNRLNRQPKPDWRKAFQAFYKSAQQPGEPFVVQCQQ